MQGLDDLCGQCESLPLIAVVFPAYNPCVTSQLKLPEHSEYSLLYWSKLWMYFSSQLQRKAHTEAYAIQSV